MTDSHEALLARKRHRVSMVSELRHQGIRIQNEWLTRIVTAEEVEQELANCPGVKMDGGDDGVVLRKYSIRDELTPLRDLHRAVA